MTTIVVNTVNRAVTEYDWTLQSVAPSRATSNAGLHALGGDTDAGALIASEIRGGKPGGEAVQRVGNVYIAVRGAGGGTLIVQGRDVDWTYPVVARASGVSSVRPGGGIRDSYIGFGYRNGGGADFVLDRIDAEVVKSDTRRK